MGDMYWKSFAFPADIVFFKMQSMPLPREFYIEDRLEEYRFDAPCNLGESGIRNFDLGELIDRVGLGVQELRGISLQDSPNRGSSDLRKAVSRLYPGAGPENVLITTGTGEALYLFFQAKVHPFDRVSLLWPAFQSLYEIPAFLGAKVKKVSALGSVAIHSLFEDVDMVVLNHPHNPTGYTLTSQDKEILETELQSFRGTCLFDEHYRFLDYTDGLGWSGFRLDGRTFATGSVTKCFGVMGLRIGWIVGPKEDLEKMRSFKDYLTHTVNPISEFLTLRLLENREELQSQILRDVKANVSDFVNLSRSLDGLENFEPPGGGLVGFVKLRDGILSENYADELYKQTGVFVLPGSNFECEGYIRIGFGERRDRFQEGMEKWKQFQFSR